MKNCVLRIVIDTENEEIFEEIKKQFSQLPYTENFSFSPAIEHERYAGYSQFSSTVTIAEDHIYDVLDRISTHWMTDDEDGDIEAETDWYEGKLFHPHLYYILFQTL